MAIMCRLNHQTSSLKATPYCEGLPSLRLRAVRAIRLFESDKYSNAAITPFGLSLDIRADFLDFEWGGSIVKKHARTGADNSMVNFNRVKKRILFVEDHEDAWEIVALKPPEYKLTFARNFDEGLRLARRGYFDHILGFEAEVPAQQIRRERDGEVITRRKNFVRVLSRDACVRGETRAKMRTTGGW
jgi:hypothetical protein